MATINIPKESTYEISDKGDWKCISFEAFVNGGDELETCTMFSKKEDSLIKTFNYNKGKGDIDLESAQKQKDKTYKIRFAFVDPKKPKPAANKPAAAQVAGNKPSQEGHGRTRTQMTEDDFFAFFERVYARATKIVTDAKVTDPAQIEAIEKVAVGLCMYANIEMVPNGAKSVQKEADSEAKPEAEKTDTGEPSEPDDSEVVAAALRSIEASTDPIALKKLGKMIQDSVKMNASSKKSLEEKVREKIVELTI